MLTTIIAVSLWIATVIGWIIFNLYTKNRKLEQMVVNQQSFIDGVLYVNVARDISFLSKSMQLQATASVVVE